LNHMRHLCDSRRLGDIVPLIQELVPEYSASKHVLSLAAAEPPRKRAQLVTMPPAARAKTVGNVG